jgi:hypothetical protein
MHTTQHIQQRMSQRGINHAMVDLTLTHGIPENDKIILRKKEALELLESLRQDMRILMKIIDKGGVTVVAENDSLITTYNCEHRKH